MSYPDVVKSTSGQGPQKAVVNVTQRSQPSSAALIESEAGIKKGHVNSIANLFGPKPTEPAAKLGPGPSSHGRTSARASNEPSQSVRAPNWSVTQTGVETSPKTKQTKSFGKSDSDIFSSSNRLDSNDASAPNKPTIVFNKTKYVPRLTQSADRSGQADQQKAQSPQGSDIPNPVRVGRWTVYETLPMKDAAGASQSQTEVKQRELEAKRKRDAEEEEWRRREAQEKERIADAERRKADYDRRQREELESQDRRRREKQAAAADEERKRREILERERKEQEEKRVREETERRKEQEQRRWEQLTRDRVEQEERRQREETQCQEELRHRERLERQMEEEKRRREEAERLMKQERTRREQLERENEARRRRETEEREEIRRREEVERQVKQERMRELKRRENEEYERKQREALENKRHWEKRVKEEETRRRTAEERKMRDSSQDALKAEEWAASESGPSTSAQIRGIVPTQVKQDQDCPSYLRGPNTVGYRRLPTSNDSATLDERKAVKETEYDRCLRQLEEAQRSRLKEEDEVARQRSRDAQRQREDDVMRRSEEQKRRDEESRFRQAEEERRRKDELQRQRDDGRNRGNKETRFHEGVEQWSALVDAGDLGQSGLAVGYRRLLGSDNQGENKGNTQEARNLQAAENDTRDRQIREQDRLHCEEERRRREARESEENRRRREVEERENNRRKLEEERKQREDEYRRRADEDDRLRRKLEDERKRREENEEFQRAGSESVPAKDSTASYTKGALHRSPSHDSITGYRRLIEDSAEQPKSDTTNRYYQREFTRRLTSGSNEVPTRFEEWTEYHTTPSARLQSSCSNGDLRPAGGRRESDSDVASTDDEPTFEEWTVVHPIHMAQSGPAYDTTDSGIGDSFGLEAARAASPSKNGRVRRFKSTESLSLLGSGEFQAVEEIMPRRCDTGKRKKDAMIAAVLRQLEAGPPPSSASLDDDAGTARLSPYHSYQRIHSRGGPYQQQQQQGGEGVDNGNVFQESFAITRNNPAFYWLE